MSKKAFCYTLFATVCQRVPESAIYKKLTGNSDSLIAKNSKKMLARKRRFQNRVNSGEHPVNS
ncbi:hypothetical protein [Pantoea sp. ICBG 1758]|uniref:hypothetical protein n=1 Tax=Pantoea sp. ICBG 1758 TaxID=2071682 RepID=UPI0011AFF6C8|nr:hypothetical protein [Pantoea sp. ICBG 1758]